MSNFWNDDQSSEEEKIENQKQNPFFVQKEKGKYAYESESSEEEKRVMKTPKDKLLEVIKSNYNKIKDFIENKNYVGVSDVFDDIIKQSDKVKNLFPEKLPDSFIRILYLTEESINISKEEKSKLSSKNNTAFNNLKKNFTKQIKSFEDALKQYKENKPSEEQLIEDEKADELSEANESISSESSIPDLQNDKNEDPAVRRLKWVKKKPEEIKKEEGKKEGKDKEKPRKDKIKKEKEIDEQPVMRVLTENDIEQECNEISKQRGQIGKKPEEIVSRIDYLLTITQNTSLKIKLLNLDILICFDTSPGQFSALTIQMWKKIHDSIVELLNYYEELESNEKGSDLLKNITFILQSSLISILEKLELELYKSLQYTDQNSSDYINRVKDELKFLLLCSKIENFYNKLDDQLSISRIYLLIILHIYYKSEETIKKMIERFNLQINRDEYLITSCENPEKFMEKLCNKIYKYCDEKSKIKALLANVYFLSIYNKYYIAKDLFKRSQVFEIIHVLKDYQLKMLFNRTLAQLGLAAFRTGEYTDSFKYLHPICSTGTSKLKEYLSQSYNKENEKSILFDKEDKKRMTPYIMTINIDEVECTYYIVSIIIDLPNILLFKMGKKYKPFNMIFKKLLDNYTKQIFNGPPESIKELILCSATYLTKGDWKKCSELILSLRIYNHHKINQEIKDNISKHIKQVAVKCFLILYSEQFKSFSLNSLSSKFEIQKNELKTIINNMILENELFAKWSGEILEVINIEMDVRMIKRLQENLNTITEQNLTLIELTAKNK